MKKIILIILLAMALVPVMAQEQQTNIEYNRALIAKLKDRYKGNKDVTQIEIGTAMTRNLATTLRENGNDQSAKMMESITSLSILVESGKQYDFFTDMFDIADMARGLELITTVDRFGEYSKFLFGSNKGDDSEFLMCVRRKENRILLYVTGDFTVADISQLSALGGVE